MVGGTGYSTHSTPGHSNRIFSLKFHPLDSNTIVSGKCPPFAEANAHTHLSALSTSLP